MNAADGVRLDGVGAQPPSGMAVTPGWQESATALLYPLTEFTLPENVPLWPGNTVPMALVMAKAKSGVNGICQTPRPWLEARSSTCPPELKIRR